MVRQHPPPITSHTHLTLIVYFQENPELKSRLDEIIQDAKWKLEETRSKVPKNNAFFRKKISPPQAPIFISITTGFGTPKARANDLDGYLYQYKEQESLKLQGAKM